MQRTTKIITAAGLAVVLAGGGVSYAIAQGTDDGGSQRPITGSDLDQAIAAALASTGGGRVTETEVGDEDSYYEIEVTLEDGTQVDVQLDEQFNVVRNDPDDDRDDRDDDRDDD